LENLGLDLAYLLLGDKSSTTETMAHGGRLTSKLSSEDTDDPIGTGTTNS